MYGTLILIGVVIGIIIAILAYTRRMQAKEFAKREELKLKQSAEAALDHAQAQEEKLFHKIRDKI